MGSDQKFVKVRAIVKEKQTIGGFLKNLGVGQTIDNIDNLLLGTALELELISSQLPPVGKLGSEKRSPVKAQARAKARKLAVLSEAKDLEEMKYEANFDVPLDFGEIGAILVQNVHQKEMFLSNIVLKGLPNGQVITIDCDSWVASKSENPEKRIFFTNKSYLPSQTPIGLKSLRTHELEILRGNGKGERESYDRIYDYDTYNDLGNPDKNMKLLRPVLGGSTTLPYPRRCRTGRPMSKVDQKSESRGNGLFYVPRDEQFADIKALSFGINTLAAVLNALIPSLEAAIVDPEIGFPDFTAINELFSLGVDLPKFKDQKEMRSLLPNLLKDTKDAGKDILCFKTTDMFERDELGWFRDEEFARQMLAGLNPYGIKLVKEWPLKSNLDPKIYGPPMSAITDEIILPKIGNHTVKEAIAQKKLYMLDYHDVLLPFVGKIRQIKGTTLYGSRTILYLSDEGTLVPVAIELTRPPLDNKPQWKRVYTHTLANSTDAWLWRLAKAHVLAHDSAYHQLISHWLRTHCCTEPYIIAANRQLSAVHPIYRLLYPHFRYTMEINALAREALINANGIIESSFSARNYSMEFSSVVYAQQWRFDLQGLPADLISRGMAEEDPSAPHGLRLSIQDYPFANDGLILWDAIKEWVTEYVLHYYPQSGPNPNPIQSDEELQAWWAEIKNVGHADKKSGWPNLQTQDDLIGILTTMIWVSSGHHAAVNFGQYTYAGYFPNRPTIARTNMPDEDPTEEEWKGFVESPDKTLLESFPSQIQAMKVMAVLEVLSNHSPDEEYIGERAEPSWGEDEAVNAAFGRFRAKLEGLDKAVDERNGDSSLRNRFGAGVVPYELFKPFSKPGVTGKGVPNSISI
ncbi:hypothetical protein V2J09_018466 [Rumex salicifolius]